MKHLRLRAATKSPSTEGVYYLRDDDQGHRVGLVYGREHAVQIVESVNALSGLNPYAVKELVEAAEAALTRFREDKVDGYHEQHPVFLLEQALKNLKELLP